MDDTPIHSFSTSRKYLNSNAINVYNVGTKVVLIAEKILSSGKHLLLIKIILLMIRTYMLYITCALFPKYMRL